MWFEQVVRRETGCASYLLGSTNTGDCLVFDPLWDIQPYLEIADRQRSRIAIVIDSHSHADHVSGARRLAQATGARLLIHETFDTRYDAERVRHGDHVPLGEVDVEIVHVPGHRPEQITLLVRDLGRGADPWCLLTADSLLVGDLARPDLAQESVDGASQLYEQTVPRLLALPDFVEIYPGHVAGST